MKIGVLGKGMIGGTLGRLWARQGYEVMWGVRDPSAAAVHELLEDAGWSARAGTVAEAVAFGDVVLLAVNWPAAGTVVGKAASWEGKVLVDATNPLSPPEPEAPSAAEQVARWAPGARVVKAFSSTSFTNMADTRFGAERAENFICGDDEAAKRVVRELSEAIDFPVVDCGPLSNAQLLESLAKLWLQLAFSLGYGRDIAFKLLRR